MRLWLAPRRLLIRSPAEGTRPSCEGCVQLPHCVAIIVGVDSRDVARESRPPAVRSRSRRASVYAGIAAVVGLQALFVFVHAVDLRLAALGRSRARVGGDRVAG